jgi:hypothetical protein
MKELISQFYEDIRTTEKPPIPYREIIITARMMDKIFRQIAPALEETENPLAHAVP